LTIAGLRAYGDWRHVATGCTVLVKVKHVKTLKLDKNAKTVCKLCAEDD